MGVQQSAPPSAGIFALIVGYALQDLFNKWAAKGVTFSIDFLMEPLSMGGPVVMTSSSTLRAGKSWP